MIWLASYPRSGNTWFRILLANLKTRDDQTADINIDIERTGIASDRSRFDNMLMVESGVLTHLEVDRLRPSFHEFSRKRAEMGNSRPPGDLPCMKVHDAYTLTSHGEPVLAGKRGADGAILIVRDPRSVAASLADFRSKSIDETIEFMNDPDASFAGKTHGHRPQLRQRLLSWSGHAASWLDQKDLPVHMIRYEDLVADTCGVLARALVMTGRSATSDQIQRAVSLAAFDRLREQESIAGFKELPHPERPRFFFRRGLANAWQDELSPSQIARIEEAHASMMRRLGYTLSGEFSLEGQSDG